MLKKLVLLLCFGAISAGIAYMVIPRNVLRDIYISANYELKIRKAEPIIAVFDWKTKNLTANRDTFQYFDYRISKFSLKHEGNLNKINKEQPILITVDMWTGYLSGNAFESIMKGDLDEKVDELCSNFIRLPNRIYIRWNPEMEVPAKLYPWQGKSPLIFNEAFEHFVKICKKRLPDAQIVWSTAGYPGVLEYYPGDGFIDYLGVTLQSPSEKSTKDYPSYKSVSAEIESKIHRMRFINKPILVFGQPNQVLGSINNEIASASLKIKEHQAISYGTLINPGIKDNTSNLSRDSIFLGVYDPKKKLHSTKEVSIEHLFPNWGDLRNGSFKREFNEVISRNHHVIVTMEPWREVEGQADTNILINTVKGHYDDRFRELFSILSSVNKTVYLRWTHEMEIPVTRYPWQSQPPVNYIKAFRHFASFRNANNKNIKIVFGPAGDRGLQDWWPGDDVVDYISMAIYGLPDKNITDYRKQESFSTIYNRKLSRMRFFNKPIIVSEFGIKGPEDYQLDWLMKASKTINENPQIKGVCYFNMVDTPKAWGDIEAPDWSVSKETFRLFIQSLNLKTSTNTLVSN